MNKPNKIDEYIYRFPEEVQKRLEQVWQTIKNAVPEAEELISYQMPAYKLNGILVWFAANKEHIGFYPKAEAISVFKDDLLAYKCTKGTVQFPHTQPIPYDIIKMIIKARVKKNEERAKTKKNESDHGISVSRTRVNKNNKL
jgi:uncharacterized protein YdhG (YjbR/CyaY superfamily)